MKDKKGNNHNVWWVRVGLDKWFNPYKLNREGWEISFRNDYYKEKDKAYFERTIERFTDDPDKLIIVVTNGENGVRIIKAIGYCTNIKWVAEGKYHIDLIIHKEFDFGSRPISDKTFMQDIDIIDDNIKSENMLDALDGFIEQNLSYFEEILCKIGEQGSRQIPRVNEIIDVEDFEEELPAILKNKNKRNLIIQCAPNTGRNYAETLALSIIDGKAPNNQSAIIKRYEKLLKQGQIEFCTFDQSMDYENFVERMEEGVVEDGVFKQMCNKARSECNVDEVYDKLVSKIADEGKDFPLKTPPPHNQTYKIEVADKKLFISATTSSSKKEITKDDVSKFYKNGDGSFKKFMPTIIEKLEELGLKKMDNTANKYVLIIDNINQDNVSRAYGDLITLMETNKRLLVGADNTKENNKLYKGELKYSKESLVEPSNLYIIGIMESADLNTATLIAPFTTVRIFAKTA